MLSRIPSQIHQGSPLSSRDDGKVDAPQRRHRIAALSTGLPHRGHGPVGSPGSSGIRRNCSSSPTPWCFH